MVVCVRPAATRGFLQSFLLNCHSASESVFPRIWIKLCGVSLSWKTCFQTENTWRFEKSTSWEWNVWQMYMCHVLYDVCGVWREDWQVNHGEDKLFCAFKSTHYSSFLLFVVIRFEYSKFELFFDDLWVVVTHEYYKVSKHATHD